MLAGLKNLLEASKASAVKRFVHLSSTAVYGNPPPKESEHEHAKASPHPGTYGWEKLKQDEMVGAATASGLDCVLLCPPNISGIYSSFVNNALKDIRNGTFALVDGGKRPNNTIDVDNLVHAIRCALEIPKGDGKRIFVTDGDGLTWKDLSDALLPLAELTSPIANISAAELASPPIASQPPNSLWQSFKHLASSEVRAAIRRDPRWARVDTKLRKLVALTGTAMEDQVRHSIEGPRKIEKLYEPQRFSSRYTTMQLLGVCHRIDRARDILGYEPQLSFSQSMERFRLWYMAMHGFAQPYWPLARRLETV
jgi:nucleoside-diphosphate-sugar epimerase